jgi:hypothetical protein
MKTIPQIIIYRLAGTPEEVENLNQSYLSMRNLKTSQDIGADTREEHDAIALNSSWPIRSKVAWVLLHSITFSRGTFVIGILLLPIAVVIAFAKALDYLSRFTGI